jgi:DNA-binding response OmpR family regulator
MPPDRAPCGRRILLVTGDTEAGTILTRQLAPSIGAAVDTVATAAEARDRLESGRFDLLLMDLPLPDIEGSEFCRLLRQRRFAAPIVMLSGSRAETEAIEGLDAGANDFVTKPCHPGLLSARLRAHLRQFERSEDAVLEIGRHVLDCGRRCLTERGTGRRIVLTAKEAALLRYLYLNRDRPARPAAIMRDVWGHRGDLETHTAETHIYRLRQKIEPDPAHPRLLVRVVGGYQLVGLATAAAAAEGSASGADPGTGPRGETAMVATANR